MFAKSTKVLVAALVLAGTSLTFIADASATPYRGGWSQTSGGYMQERVDPTNTNGN
jgi:hypothetical protein